MRIRQTVSLCIKENKEKLGDQMKVFGYNVHLYFARALELVLCPFVLLFYFPFPDQVVDDKGEDPHTQRDNKDPRQGRCLFDLPSHVKISHKVREKGRLVHAV